jgi:hypothetical protein
VFLVFSAKFLIDFSEFFVRSSIPLDLKDLRSTISITAPVPTPISSERLLRPPGTLKWFRASSIHRKLINL